MATTKKTAKKVKTKVKAPLQASAPKKLKKKSIKGVPQKCTVCHKPGHNKRKHKNDKKPAAKKATPKKK